MSGYIRASAPGKLEPLEDGWHDTGDIVTIDDEGYIRIRGRLKRFAKVGGPGESRWRARHDSNVRPSAPQADALSN